MFGGGFRRLRRAKTAVGNPGCKTISRQSDQLTVFANDKLAALDATQRRRKLVQTVRGMGGSVVRDGRMVVSFSDNDYLGLSQNPRVVAAAGASAIRYGAGASASRLVSGDSPLNHDLENLIASMKNMPAARVFGSGYMANIGVVPALVGKGDIVVVDALSHSCLHAGARLSGAEIRVFRHNDLSHAREQLTRDRAGGRALLVTETVFSMDGDLAPLSELFSLCEETDAWMMTDDAHGFGVIHQDNPALIQTGSLSKSAGVYGGYVCGPVALVDLLISRARSFVYSTGLPPQVLGAAIEALRIISDDDTLGQEVMARATQFAKLMGLPRPRSAIVPIIVGGEARALDLQARLLDDGFHVAAIRPPTVPEGTSRLRISFSAAHEESDVENLASSLKVHMETVPDAASG